MFKELMYLLEVEKGSRKMKKTSENRWVFFLPRKNRDIKGRGEDPAKVPIKYIF